MAQQRNQLRIIGGQWRGRKLAFPEVEGLRPTTDRVRETVFNWLMPVIQGARCLDLFAGSGAMGLEALSRGAAKVVLVDNNRQVIQQLQQNLELLNASNALVHQADTLHFLADNGRAQAEPYDVVFLDPPYQADLLAQCFSLLEQHGWLSEHAYIYLECDAHQTLPALPSNWQLHRHKTAGQVSYHLAIRGPAER